MKNLLAFLLLANWLCSPDSFRIATRTLIAAPPAASDSCDNPDADVSCCFNNMPSNITNKLTITKRGEPGEPLEISGRIFQKDGKTPYAGIVIYAYQTDSDGYYSKTGNEKGVQKWHGRLHGWCKTDKKGQYQIQTIRPGQYPNGNIPAHIHAVLRLPNGEAFYINDFVFKDDKFVTSHYIRSLRETGGNGIVDLKRSQAGWTGTRDIVLDR